MTLIEDGLADYSMQFGSQARVEQLLIFAQGVGFRPVLFFSRRLPTIAPVVLI